MGIRLLLLGIVLLLAGLAASWAQDVAAPWINAGEARMGSTVTFASGGGEYRVITSGPTRPQLEQTACTVTTSREREFEVLGGKDVNPAERFGVSRVLAFEVPEGTTRVRCADRIIRGAAHGRFQIVAGDGPISIAVLVAFGLGAALLVGGIVLLLLAYRASQSGRLST